MRYLTILLTIWISCGAFGQSQSTDVAKRDSLINLAKQAVDKGDEDSAWSLTQKASELFSKQAVCDYMFPWEEMGYYYYDSDVYEKKKANNAFLEKYLSHAIKELESSADNFKGDDLMCWSDEHCYLGKALRDQGKIAKSKRALEVAFEGYQKLKKANFKFEMDWVVGEIYIPLANIYTRLEDYKSAESLHLLAQNEFFKLGLMESKAESATDYGILLAAMGETNRAIDVFSQQLEFPKLSLRTKAIVLQGRANCYLQLRNLNSAMKDAKDAIAYGHKLNDEPAILMDAYLVKGQIESQLKNYQMAANNFMTALQYGLGFFPARSRSIGKIYVSLGQLYLLMADEPKSLAYFQQALYAVLPQIDTVDIHSLPKVNDLYAENTILESLEGKAQTYEQMANRMKDDGTKYLRPALQNLQLCFIEEGLISAGQLHASSKVQFQNLNRQRREKALEICASLYQKTGDVQYALQAFDIAEGGKASVLLEGVTEYLIKKEVGKDNPVLQEIDELENVLSSIEARLLSLEEGAEDTPQMRDDLNDRQVVSSQKLRMLKRAFQEQYPYFSMFQQASQQDKAALVRDTLLPNNETVFVEYVLGAKYLFGFTIRKEKPIHFFSIPRTADFNNSLWAFAENFSAQNRWNIGANHYQETALDFYQKVVRPTGIEPFEEVIIVPDGMLATIPFEALVRTATATPFFKQLDYLLLHQNIRYAYSGAVLLKQQQQQQQQFSASSFMMVAPDFNQGVWQLPPLDVDALRVTGFDAPEVLRGSNATKRNFVENAQKYRYIHLYTHAEADKDGVLPKIYFRDSVLTLPEIYTLDLSAELVVLSACETNLGKLEKGEGVMSLSRGFAYAGVASLISSLWKVKDQQTAELFTSFYSELQKQPEKSSALRQAKIDYLSTADDIHASPGYWAGFIFMGSEQAVTQDSFCWWVVVGLLGMGIGWLFLRRKGSF